MKLNPVGIQYRHPAIYSMLIPVIHRKHVIDVFKQRVGKNVSVFDIAAGFGGMERFIDKSNTYRGIDLNEKFVSYGRKKGLNIELKNIFNKNAYQKSDVLILVDVIHHIPTDKLKALFDLVFFHATKRVVIMEPSFLNLEKKYGFFGTPIDWIFRKLDSDGINDIESWFTADEYRQMFTNRFGSKAGYDFIFKIEESRPYFVVTFSRK